MDVFWRCLKDIWKAGLHKTGIHGIQDNRQIVDGKTNDKEINDKKDNSWKKQFDTHQ